jgi:hypothetical protein
MVRRPNLFKYLPIRLRIFNCWDAFLQISDICLSKFSWESTVTPKSLTFFPHVILFPFKSKDKLCLFVLGVRTNGNSLKFIRICFH